MDSEAQIQHQSADQGWAPGTVQLEDATGSQLILSPQPTSDPNDPLNWSTFRKARQIALLSVYTMIVDSCMTIATPMWAMMSEESGFSYVNLNDSYAAGTGALALGCIIFVPFALRNGRRGVYILTSVVVLGMAVWSAKMTTTVELYVTQIIMCLAGIANQTLFEISIADMYFVHQRGTLNGIYLAMTMIGNFLAPVASGYVAESQGWRWAYWWIAIFMAVVTVLMVLFLEDTKYSTLDLMSRHSPDQNVESNKTPEESAEAKFCGIDSIPGGRLTVADLATGRHIDHSVPMKSRWQRYVLDTTKSTPDANRHSFAAHFWQPFAIMFTIPAVPFGALQYGFNFSCLSLILVTEAVLYPAPPYNFSPIGVGNVIIAPAIGGLLGCVAGGIMTDWLIIKLAKRRGGVYEPEMRLWLFFLPGIAMPIGLFVYGLTISQGAPWIINSIGAAFVTFSLSGCGSIVVTYIQDSYLEILGDSLVGVSFIRNLIATALVFGVPSWMDSMSVYNIFLFMGCLSIAFVAGYVPVLIWGKRWRRQTAARYALYAQRQYESRPL